MNIINQKGKELVQILVAIVISSAIFWYFTEKVIVPNLQAEISRVRAENVLLRSDLNKLRYEIAAEKPKKNFTPIPFPSTEVDIPRLRDYTIEQDRRAIISDLLVLASKAQQYYATTVTFDGGGASFLGLTADARGMAHLASLPFTDNAHGTYSIKTSGDVNRVVLHAVGKIALTNGSFPAYDMMVTSQTRAITKIN